MIWSFSTHNMFRRCQRQWFYNCVLANARAKDPLRKEAYRLSKLQNVNAWRGHIVDETISQMVVASASRGTLAPLVRVVDYARHLFEEEKTLLLQASRTGTLQRRGE
jgi:hypothetical protein